jgi:hypothetical protein
MAQNLSIEPSSGVIARYQPIIWLAPICVIGMAAALALTPYLLGYASIPAFVSEHRHGA